MPPRELRRTSGPSHDFGTIGKVCQNLDRASASEVMDLLDAMNRDGQTVVLVTHDPEVAARAKSMVRMDDGEIVERT